MFCDKKNIVKNALTYPFEILRVYRFGSGSQFKFEDLLIDFI